MPARDPGHRKDARRAAPPPPAAGPPPAWRAHLQRPLARPAPRRPHLRRPPGPCPGGGSAARSRSSRIRARPQPRARRRRRRHRSRRRLAAPSAPLKAPSGGRTAPPPGREEEAPSAAPRPAPRPTGGPERRRNLWGVRALGPGTLDPDGDRDRTGEPGAQTWRRSARERRSQGRNTHGGQEDTQQTRDPKPAAEQGDRTKGRKASTRGSQQPREKFPKIRDRDGPSSPLLSSSGGAGSSPV